MTPERSGDFVDLGGLEQFVHFNKKKETKIAESRCDQIAHATVQQTLKGTLPQTVELYGENFFPCAPFHYAPGRYIVFLHRSGEFLINSNWHLSCRPIKDTQAEWYAPGDKGKLSWQPLDAVLDRIRKPPAKGKSGKRD